MRDQIVRFIQDNTRFAVTSHSRPDGDSLGSSLALTLALEQLGKQVALIHADPPPHAYASLPGIERLQIASRLEDEVDGVFVLECNSLNRSGVAGLDRYPLVNIDHHRDSGDFGALNWIDWSAAALGELMLDLILALGAKITPEIAENLYVAVLTDTGSFQFSNTTAKTLAIAAQLVAYGANPGAVAQNVYLSQPLSKVKLLAKALSTLKVHDSGKIAWIWVTRKMMKEVGADPNETEGIVTHVLAIDGVSMVAFIREDGNGGFRVSLRSKPGYDISPVARRYGGGGHANAAGLTIQGELGEVQRRLVMELEQLLAPPPVQ